MSETQPNETQIDQLDRVRGLRAAQLAERIEPWLRNEHPDVAAATLAELFAIYLCAHCVADGDGVVNADATRNLRHDLIKTHIGAIAAFIPFAEERERRVAGGCMLH